MLTKMLAASAALSMLACGGAALAQTKTSAQAGPSQPIPYSQMKAYDKASPKARATKDWWSGSTSAPTGMSTDTSATTPTDATGATGADGATTGMPPASTSAPDTSVNPSSSSMPATPPTNAPTMEDKMAQPNAPGAGATPPMTPPADPK